MPLQWTKQSIEWFIHASVYTGFHEQLADQLAAFFLPEDTVCDLGCGLGLLDLELSHRVSHITAVDLSPAAISTLRENCRITGAENVHAVCQDTRNFAGHCDVGLMSFYAGTAENFFRYLGQCRRQMICIVNRNNQEVFSPTKYHTHKHTSPFCLEGLLEQWNVPYSAQRYTLEFGQPLTCREDAWHFVRHHCQSATDAEITDFVHEKVLRTKHSGFPFYLPKRKDFTIFLIDCTPFDQKVQTIQATSVF